MLKERYDEQYDASQMTWAWWSESIKDRCSTIDVTCKICGHRSKSSSLNNLKIGQAPGCLCNKKTEAKLGRWLVSEFTDSIITLQVQGCTNPDTGRPLPFDFGLYHDSVLIELDGDIGHFGRGFGGDPEDGGVPRRDFHKEYWAMQRGKVVVRLLQTDVYRDCWPWEDFLNSAVRHATCSTEPCVITQAAKEYKRGIYRKLRSDLNCKEGYFLPSRIPYLKYGADLIAARDTDAVKHLFLEVGDVYLAVEGGPGVAQDARRILARGGAVLPLKRTGGIGTETEW
ncbi:unnamed protein product [Symbiodinium microadriaticum]|nr:unnamed protein product [Symbiodinium microadriaticum]